MRFYLSEFCTKRACARPAGFYGQGAVAAPEAATGAERKLGEEAGAVSGTAEDPVFCRRQKMTPYKKVAPMRKKSHGSFFLPHNELEAVHSGSDTVLFQGVGAAGGCSYSAVGAVNC